MSTTTLSASTRKPPRSRSSTARSPRFEFLIVHAFVLLPMLALVAAVPLAWGWGLSWLDVGLAVGFYFLSGFGVHRRVPPLLHPPRVQGQPRPAQRPGDRRQPRPAGRRDHLGRRSPPPPRLHRQGGRPALAVAVRHHPAAVARGFWHAHMGWIFNRDRTNAARFAPDLLADPDISRINRQFPLWTVVSLLSPALLGGLITMSWWGALTAFFWAGLVRVAVLHHVTWSVNSICHMIGDRPWTHRDRSTNFWPLAHRLDGRVLAQPAPRRPHLRPPRRRSRPDRHVRPADLDVREARLGPRRPLAHQEPPGPAARECTGMTRSGWDG